MSVYNKNNKSIAVNDEIDINGDKFEISGIVCHSGSLCGGHYYCKAVRNDVWYEFNDSVVSKTNKECEGSQPYLLFYSKKI